MCFLSLLSNRDGSGEPSPSLPFCLCAVFFLRVPRRRAFSRRTAADRSHWTLTTPGYSAGRAFSATEVSLSPLPVTTLPESCSGIVPTSKAPSEGAMLRKGCLPASFGGNGNVSAEGNIQLSRIGTEGRAFRFHTPLLPTTEKIIFYQVFRI